MGAVPWWRPKDRAIKDAPAPFGVSSDKPRLENHPVFRLARRNLYVAPFFLRSLSAASPQFLCRVLAEMMARTSIYLQESNVSSSPPFPTRNRKVHSSIARPAAFIQPHRNRERISARIQGR